MESSDNTNQPTDQPVVSSYAAPATSTATAAPVPKRSGAVRKGLTAIAILAIFAVGFGANMGLSSYNTSKAESSARDFVSLINSGDLTKAYASGSHDMRSIQTQAQFSSIMSDLQTKNPNVLTEDIEVDGSRAIYTADVDNLPATDDGTTDGTFTLVLVRSGLNWQVDSVNVS